MDDLISRKWLVECIKEGWFDTVKDYGMMIHLVRDIAPSVQPEIILCDDCTWCQDDAIHGKVFCSREGAMDWIEPDSFCSYGERETDGSD